MAAPRLLPGRFARAAAACLLLAGAVPPAADALETGTIALEGIAYGGMVADVDGDGAREVLRLIRDPGGTGHLAVDGWRLVDGEWRSLGIVPLRRGIVVPDEIQFRDDDLMRPLLVGEPARLIRWRHGGRDRVVVATIGTRELAGRCCLSLFEVREGRGGLELRVLRGTDGSTGFGTALAVHPADLDGDGNEELVVTEPPRAGGLGGIRVLHWTAAGWESARMAPAGPMGSVLPSYIGELDGERGEEVVYVIDLPGDTTPGIRLMRIGGPPSDPRIEIAELDAVRPLVAPGITLRGVPAMLAQTTRDTVQRLGWPRGGRVELGDGRTMFAWLAGSIGRGAGTRYLFVQPEVHPAGVLPNVHIEVVGPALEPFGIVRPSSVAARLDDLTERLIGSRIQNVAPPRAYSGPFPGGVGGRDAFVFRGRLVVQGSPQAEAREIATLTDVTPLGLAGPGEAWLVLATGRIGDPEPRGGSLDSFAGAAGEVRLVEAALALLPESRRPVDLPGELAGAISAEPASTVYAPRAGFDVRLELPAGARVLSMMGRLVREHLPDPDGEVTIRIAPPESQQDAPGYEAVLIVIGPSGRAYLHSWQVEVLAEVPQLDVLAETEPFSLSARVDGTVSGPAAVTVDGSAVSVTNDGSFRASVSALPWPRPVRVEATDPLGNRSVTVVHVVGLVDYREWPWALIVTVLTLAAGLFLYLRGAELRPRPREETEVATLEEIERR